MAANLWFIFQNHRSLGDLLGQKSSRVPLSDLIQCYYQGLSGFGQRVHLTFARSTSGAASIRVG